MTSTVPAAVATSLSSLAAALYRHTHGQEPEFLCMATRLSQGIYATVADRVARKKWRENLYEDLRLHLLDGSVLWVDWAAKCPVTPVLLMEARGAEMSEIDIAGMADVAAAGTYPTVWRIGYGQPVWGKVEMEKGPRMAAGAVMSHPEMTWFRNGADQRRDERTIAAHANFDYPGKHDLGSPVVIDDGRLAGILVGGDLGPESAHQGAYVPAELVMPFIGLIRQLQPSGWRAFLAYRLDYCFHHADEDACGTLEDSPEALTPARAARD